MKGIPVNGEVHNTLRTKRIEFVRKHATKYHLKIAKPIVDRIPTSPRALRPKTSLQSDLPKSW